MKRPPLVCWHVENVAPLGEPPRYRRLFRLAEVPIVLVEPECGPVLRQGKQGSLL